MDMKTLSEKLGLAFLAEPWIYQVLLVVLATALANFAAHILLRYAEKISRQTTSPWDDALIQAGKSPAPAAIWLIGISFAANIIHKDTGSFIFDYVPQFRNAGVVVCLAWFLIRLIRNISRNIVEVQEKKGEEVDRTTIDALSKLARLAVIVTALAGYANLSRYLSQNLVLSGMAVGALVLVRGLCRELIGAALRSRLVRVSLDISHRARNRTKFWLRATLNLGHTLAHALESVGGYELLHGEAVAVGLVFAGALAGAMERVDADAVDRYRNVVSALDLPTAVPGTPDRDQLVASMQRDKKSVGGLTFVLPGALGLETVHDPDARALDIAFAAVGVGG